MSAGFIQGVGMLLPLLTIPYLLKVLGADGFGTVNFALAYTTLFIVLSDYGYNLLGTRKIVLHRNDPSAINKIFSTMMAAQALLTVLGALIFVITVFSIRQFRENASVFMATFGIVAGATLLPTWFFQGFEKFRQLYLLNFLYRLVYTVGIFWLVKDETHLIRVPLLNSICQILGGLGGILWITRRYGVRFTRVSFVEIKNSLKEGWNLFVSAASVTSLAQMPIIILSFFASAAVVGYYAFVEKILLLFRVLIQLFSTVFYPRLIEAASASYAQVKSFTQYLLRLGTSVLLVAAVAIYFSPLALREFFPSYYHPVVAELLRIWALLPLFLFLKTVYEHILLSYDQTRTIARIMLRVALLNIPLLIVFNLLLGYQGNAVVVLVNDIIILLAFRFQTHQKPVTG